MAYLVPKIVRVFTGEVNDLNNLFRRKCRRRTRALFICKDSLDCLLKGFRLSGFNIEQGWECLEETAAPVGNAVIVEADFSRNTFICRSLCCQQDDFRPFY